VSVHGRDLDDRGPEPRRRGPNSGWVQLQRAGVEIQPLGIAGLERGLIVFEGGPWDRRECGGDGAVRRVGRQVGHELDWVGGEHRAAGANSGIDVGDGLEVVRVGAEPVPPAGGERTERGGVDHVLERSAGPRQFPCRLLREHRDDARVGPKRGGVTRRGDPYPVADAGRGRPADESWSEPRSEPAQHGRVPAIGDAGGQNPVVEFRGVAGHPARQRPPVRSPCQNLPAALSCPDPNRAAVDREEGLLDRTGLPERPDRPARASAVRGLACHAYDSWTQAWAGSKWGIILRPSPAMTHR
jgi:hypothetical protein